MRSTTTSPPTTPAHFLECLRRMRLKKCAFSRTRFRRSPLCAGAVPAGPALAQAQYLPARSWRRRTRLFQPLTSSILELSRRRSLGFYSGVTGILGGRDSRTEASGDPS